MKILFPYMARWHAVNWTRYHSILEALGKLGHEIIVLQPPPLNSDETNFIEIGNRDMKNITVLEVPLNKKIWKTKFPLDKIFKKAYFSIKSYYYSKLIIRKKNIDTILLYNIPQFQFSSLKDVKIIFDYADDYIDMLSFELGKLDLYPIRKFAAYLLNIMMKRSDLVLSVSYELAKSANGNVHVVANGVNSEFLLDSPSKHDSKPIFTIGFLGSFEYFIDFDIIIQTAIRLPEYRFLLVGSGRKMEDVKSAIKQNNIMNIELVGGVPHTDIFTYIDQMDICLNIFKPIPVSHRACPIKLFEYLSRRKPVISTRLNELKYIDLDGFLYFADNVDEMVTQIKTISRKDESVQSNIELGYKLVKDKYTWEKIASDFSILVHKI